MDPAELSLAELQRLRTERAGNKQAQNYLAPYEHRAFVRELSTESPLAGLASAVVAAPYTTVKGVAQGWGARMLPPVIGQVPGFGARRALEAIGQPINEETSDASLGEVGQAWAGFGEGVTAYIRNLFR